MNASNPIAALFDQAFPSIRPPRTPNRWGLVTEADTKRAAYVAETVPQLVRMYRVTPHQVIEAFDHVEYLMRAKRHPLLSALLTRDDHAEIGRLLLAAIDERLADVANDAAEESGYNVFPEPSL
jgi:hypothetical protein